MADIAGAFCSNEDIVAVSGHAISANTKPTTTEVVTLAANRANELLAEIYMATGRALTVDGGANEIDDSTTLGKIYRARVRELNSIAAAIDQLQNSMKGVGRSSTTKLKELRTRRVEVQKDVVRLSQDIYGVNRVQTPYSEGEITEPDYDPPMDEPTRPVTIDGNEL
ncbi:MAG: hypothetical protein GY716_10285 [bacterium]|nr:hypothetical protein [bacterium]